MDRFSRRDCLRALGLGAVSVGAGTAVLAPEHDRPPLAGAPAGAAIAAGAEPPWGLLAPLTAGSTIGGVRLAGLTSVTATGTVDIELQTPDGAGQRARLCRRDTSPGAPAPVARSLHYDLFLANGGDGAKPTDEQVGVALLVLAAVVRRNEQAVAPVAVGTLRQRWQRLARRVG